MRADSRSNIFVIAALYSATGSAPVRIRNISSSGALIEGAVLPPNGAEVKLARGSLIVCAVVVWRNRGRAGLRFGSAVSVADWLPQGNQSSGQQRVDEIVYQSKFSGPASTGPLLAGPAPATAINGGLAQELQQLSDGLEIAGEALANDPEVALRFLTKLQVIDMTAQSLKKLATALAAPGPVRSDRRAAS